MASPSPVRLRAALLTGACAALSPNLAGAETADAPTAVEGVMVTATRDARELRVENLFDRRYVADNNGFEPRRLGTPLSAFVGARWMID